MPRFARLAACALAALLVSSAAIPQASAGQYLNIELWEVVISSYPQCTEESDSVQFENFGIVVSVTPVVKDRNARSEAMFVLLDDAILFNVGDSRQPLWEPISEREFRELVADLEDAGFDLTAEVVDEQGILALTLII
jgi:hypothetical protein